LSIGQRPLATPCEDIAYWARRSAERLPIGQDRLADKT
jgi:hypothetical protein